MEDPVEGISLEEATAVLNSASTDIITEISRSFDYFRDTTNYETIDEIILCGGVALTKNFATLLSERIGIDTKIANPFQNVVVPDSFDDDYINSVAPIVSVAVGLAIRRIGDK
jgi:type IV pilus assembly protein PilM